MKPTAAIPLARASTAFLIALLFGSDSAVACSSRASISTPAAAPK